MFNRRGQNIAEYSILIALVVAAAVAMNTYVKRGVQGRMKDAVDTTQGGGGFTFSGKQYEPYYASSNGTSSQQKKFSDTWAKDGKLDRNDLDERSQLDQNSWEATSAAK